MTQRPLKVLFVEDSPVDAGLEERELEKAGLAISSLRIETPEELLRALSEFKPDLIISDYSMPAFDGLAALKTVRDTSPEIPFIFVSGVIGEERAIESLKHGATDYVVKDHLGSLPVKVRRALKEVEDERQRQKLEVQFQQAQKMEVVGRLAGGIAHDFNNLLTAIIGYAELTLNGLDQDNSQRPNVEEVIKAGQRASTLTRQLLAFSRKKAISLKVLNLNQIVLDVEKMLRRTLGEDVQVEMTLAPDLGNVKADPGQIEQVVLNLALNARDAMPNGGKLTLETRNVELDQHFAEQHVGAKVGPHIMLAVSDTGFGMDAEVMAHLFEPFFTTKEPGKGTGLGLSIVYGIVKQCEGSVSVYSEPGHGTTFKIYIPRATDPLEGRRSAPVQGSTAKGSETLLLVEDEESVRKLMSDILQASGYKVLVAPDGDEALRLATGHAGPIHLLVTDVVMPKMGGPELALQMVRRRPEMRVLFSSGYTEKGIVANGMVTAESHFLQKPFSMEDLLRKVREVLDSGVLPR